MLTLQNYFLILTCKKTAIDPRISARLESLEFFCKM